MHSKLAAYVTTGPVTRPEAAWAKSVGLPHLSYASAHALVYVIVAMVIVAVGLAVKKLFA
jgi:hypothetical protein